jgi:hypothetical protein
MNMPLAVVGIAGKYRSGKSTLISRLIGRNDAFEVGHSVNSCTKGILAHEAPIRMRDGRQVLVLDSEGLNALDSDVNHDVRIFALTVLLSSVFVYNVSQTLDESTLSSLKVVMDFVRMMKMGADEETTQHIADEMPTFVVAVRDFALQLRRPNGSVMTSDEWLEEALAAPCSPQNSDQSRDKVALRETVKKLFPRRRCFTLPRPTLDESLLTKMDTVQDDQLRPEFVMAAKSLQDEVIQRAPLKSIMGEKMTGLGLLRIAQQLVECINSAQTPRIRDSWVLLGQLKSQEVLNRVMSDMRRISGKWVESKSAPLANIRRALTKLEQETVQRFIDEVGTAPDQGAEQQLRQEIAERVREVLLSVGARKMESIEINLRTCAAKLAECEDGEIVRSIADVRTQVATASDEVGKLVEASGMPDLLQVGHVQWAQGCVFDPVCDAVTRLDGVGSASLQQQELEEDLVNMQAQLKDANELAAQQCDDLRKRMEAESNEHLQALQQSAKEIEAVLRGQIETLAEERANAIKECNEAVDKCAMLIEDAAKLRSTAEAEQETMQMLRKDSVALQTVTAELQEAKHSLQLCEDELVAKTKSLAQNSRNFEDQLSEYQQQAEQCVGRKKKELEDLRQEHTDRVHELEQSRQESEQVKQGADRAIGQLKSQVDTLTQRLEEKASACREVKASESALRLEQQQLVNAHRQELADLQRQHRNELAKVEATQGAELAGAQAQRVELEGEVSKLQSAHQQAKRDLEFKDELDRENKRLKVDYEKEKITGAQNRTALEILERQIASKEEELTEQRSRTNMLTDKCNQLEQQNVRLNYDLSLRKIM